MRAPRIPFIGACPECDHDWREHPGGGWDDDATECGECRYEVDHDERPAGAGEPCALRAPAAG